MYPLSPLDSVVLTRDHGQVMRALERFQGRKFDYTPRNALEDRYANYPAETVERVRRQVSLSALTGLAVKLGSLREGRKAILLVSEGYIAMLPPQMRGPIATMPGVGNPNRNNPFAGENNMNEDRAQFMGELDVQSELQRVYDSANRSNTAIYAVDPRGLSTGEFDIQDNIGMRTSQDSLRQTQNTLRTLADETDGRAIVNRNDLAKGDAAAGPRLERLLPAGLQLDAVAQRRQVPRDQGAREAAGVAGARPQRVLGPDADRNRAGRGAAQAGPAPRRRPVAGRHLRRLRAPLHPHLGRHRAGRAGEDAGHLRVGGDSTAAGQRPGGGGPRRAHGARSRRATRCSAGRSGPRRRAARFAAGRRRSTSAPGKLTLRLSIEGRPEDVLDTDDRTIDVPDFTEPKARLTTPRVYVARNAREFQTIKNDPAVAPAATREFRRTERLLLRLGAVAPGASAGVTYTARLLNRQGDKMADVPVTAVAGDGVEGGTIDFPLANLPAGEFLLEVAAKDAEGAETTELIAFRMVG